MPKNHQSSKNFIRVGVDRGVDDDGLASFEVCLEVFVCAEIFEPDGGMSYDCPTKVNRMFCGIGGLVGDKGDMGEFWSYERCWRFWSVVIAAAVP